MWDGMKHCTVVGSVQHVARLLRPGMVRINSEGGSVCQVFAISGHMLVLGTTLVFGCAH